MSSEKKPWEVKEKFITTLEATGNWSEMARYYTKAGYSVTEATIRRWADKHNLRAWYLEDKLKKSQDEVRTLKTSVDKLTKELDSPRTATPEELVSAERELEKAKQRVARYKTVAQNLAKEANFMDDIKEHLAGFLDDVKIKPINVKPPKPSKNSSPVSLVLGLSDGHVFDTVDPRTVNGQNSYNVNIACKRLERVVDVTTTYGENYAAFRGVDELIILLNGDNISNMDGIHPEESTDTARICKQVLNGAMLYAQVITELSQVFPKVRVICSADDNHSRTTKKSATSSVSRDTSWNTILNEFVAAHTIHLPNVDFHMGESYLTFFEVKGATWCLTHGHNVKGGGMAGVPVNGLKKLNDIAVSKSVAAIKATDLDSITSIEDAIALMRGLVSVVLAGHHHQSFGMQQNGTVVKVMPSLKGPDTFSLDILNKYNPAEQALFAVDATTGIVGDHTIHLQDIVTEAPTRYVMGALEGTTPSSHLLREKQVADIMSDDEIPSWLKA
jgi:hypothetical protein